MDVDPNDLLSTNQYISEPQLTDIKPELGEEFRKYYENDIKKKEQENVVDDLKNFRLDDTLDDNNILNTNNIIKENNTLFDTKIIQRTLKTLISIDSRDRDLVIFKKPNHFKIFLGKTFTNVKSVKLVSIEFPNTDAVINSKNNKIAWRNFEDIELNNIDSATQTYPVYNVDLRIGSYNLRTLQTEIGNSVGLIKRRRGAGDFHYFNVDLDSDTDIVSFTSLILIQLDNNPIDLTKGVNIVKLSYPPDKPHGYKTGDLIYIIGAKTVGGITAQTLNTSHIITVISSTEIQFEITVKASESVQGGGNTIKTGKLAPFQLLFGENENTIAQNLGFPLENSSQRVDVFIKEVNTINLVEIELDIPHVFTNTYDFIGKQCRVIGTNTEPSITGGTLDIISIPSSTTIIIESPNLLKVTDDNSNGTLTFTDLGLNVSYDIKSVKNYQQETTRIISFTEHRYTLNDIGSKVVFYNTKSQPPIDGEKTIAFISSPTEIIIAQKTFIGSSTLVPNTIGSFPVLNPLTSFTNDITGVTISNTNNLIFSSPNHGLSPGDSIKLYNIKTVPEIEQQNSTFIINSVPSLDEFVIDYQVSSVVTNNPYFGKNIFELTFPNHGFNGILSMTDSTLVDERTTETVGVKKITTIFPHGFIDESNIPNDYYVTGGNSILVKSKYEKQSQYIRFNNTGFSAYDDIVGDNSYKVEYVDNDEFIIYQLNSDYTLNTNGSSLPNATGGILGLSNDFYLYSLEGIGGIKSELLNKQLFTVKNIINTNTFSFEAPSVFADVSKQGGGSNVYINSLKHGFNGIQDNTKNTILNRSINLEGENYSFLCCPQLSTMMNTGKVNDVFARITLDQSPGSLVFSFLSNPKDFDIVPLAQLNELEFYVRNYDNSLYEFNDLDFSFTLEVTEVLDTTENFNTSSRMVPSNLKNK